MKTEVASLQQNVTKLQSENATLKQQLADLQAAFDAVQSRTSQGAAGAD